MSPCMRAEVLDPPTDASGRRAEWWDGRDPQSFFRTVYLRGDASLEGWLEGRQLGLADRTAREAEGALRLASVTRDDLILDCPTGYGRHSLYLADRGYRVVGVDLNPEFIERAKEAARTRPPRARPWFIQGDMRCLPLRSASCSVVFNLVLSFGFFGTDEENQAVLREFARVLCPGGRLLVHGDINPARIESGTYGDRPRRTLPGGATLLVQERYNSAGRRVEGKWTIVEGDGRRSSAEYSLQVYQVEEFRAMMACSGLTLRAIYGSLDPGREAYGPASQEFILLAERA